MSAATQTAALHMARAGPAPALGLFAPSMPLLWLYLEKRRASAPGMPALTRLRALLHDLRLYLCYDLPRQPVVSEGRRLVVPDFRVGHFTRHAARSLCTNDRGVVYAVPAYLPLGAEIGLNPTQVCPYLQPAEDARQAALYAETDLRRFVNEELAEENAFLRAENARMNYRFAAILAALNDEDV